MVEEAGFSPNFWEEDSAYSRAWYQNTNISVGVTDAFMRAVENKEDWNLISRTTGETIHTVKAHELFYEMAKAAWICGDPGVQFEDTINSWNTCPNSGRITTSNPCSEVFFLDHSSCNLAVLNLIKFWENDTFNIQDFKAAVERAITAQEILCELGTYPTPEITQTTKDFRPLGLGFTNLGGLLMVMGLPYDSDEARATARGIASLMTATAYLTSARLAKVLGPFKFFRKNKKPMLAVLNRHSKVAAEMEDSFGLIKESLKVWKEAVNLGSKQGFRNAQVTCQPPAGTTSFMLDADTTGIEPEVSLLRVKFLSGGGVMNLVNRLVPQALERLGYSKDEIDTALKYIEENKTIQGCPVLKPEHEPVFHCAYPAAPGDKCVSPMGHLLMLAAVQPVISGGISKTVALPHETTVDEILNIYTQAWKLGLKSVTVYRDGSKASQPVSTEKGKNGKNGRKKPKREKLPTTRKSITHKFSVAGHDGYITVGTYEDGRPGEVFLVMNKEGSVIRGLMDAFAITLSVGLQHGIPLECFCKKLEHMRFDPSGITGNPEIPFAKSPVDYIARWLMKEFGPGNEDGNGNGEEVKVLGVESSNFGSDASVCAECGSIMVRTGACHTCPNCGSTTSCG